MNDPPKVKRPNPVPPGPNLSTNSISSHHTTNEIQGSRVADQVRARRAASRRIVGGDPWWYEPPGERGYPEAASHLLELGLTAAPNLPALRAMYKSGGDDRRVAEVIARRWDIAA